jgi:uncharacterized protein (DUF1330 family)
MWTSNRWSNAMNQRIALGLTLLAGIAIGATAIQGLHAQAKPKAYTVSEIEVIDASATAAYGALVTPRINANGGHALNTAGGKIVGIVGAAPPTRVAINEWNSLEQAQAFYSSSAWKDLAPQRDKAQKILRLYAVEAVQ